MLQKWENWVFSKLVSLRPKLYLPKRAIKDSKSTLEFFYAKSGSKKKLIFEK